MTGVIKRDLMGCTRAAVNSVEEEATDDVVGVTYQVVEDRNASC